MTVPVKIVGEVVGVVDALNVVIVGVVVKTQAGVLMNVLLKINVLSDCVQKHLLFESEDGRNLKTPTSKCGL